MVLEFRMGDIVKLRKPHPCGGFDWEVVRLGADIGLACATCGRRVLLDRRTLERRLKAFVSRGPELDPEIERLLFPTLSPGPQDQGSKPPEV
jgi:hypothetical protein